MCGIFGWQIKPGVIGNKGLKKLSRGLAKANDKRGKDSWGYFGYNHIKNGDHKAHTFTIRKELGAIYPQIKQFTGYYTLMAHCRRASPGYPVSTQNAHPFVFDNIIGAHNGCVNNHTELNKKYGRNCTVDSEHLFMHLEKRLPFKDIMGYGSMEWVDQKKGMASINLMKYQQDLHVIELEKDKEGELQGVIWSSVPGPIITYLNQRNMQYKEIKIEEGKIYRVTNYKVYDTENSLLFSTENSKVITNNYTINSRRKGRKNKKKFSAENMYANESAEDKKLRNNTMLLMALMTDRIRVSKKDEEKQYLRIIDSWVRRGVLSRNIEQLESERDLLAIQRPIDWGLKQRIQDKDEQVGHLERALRQLDAKIRKNSGKTKLPEKRGSIQE